MAPDELLKQKYLPRLFGQKVTSAYFGPLLKGLCLRTQKVLEDKGGKEGTNLCVSVSVCVYVCVSVSGLSMCVCICMCVYLCVHNMCVRVCVYVLGKGSGIGTASCPICVQR